MKIGIDLDGVIFDTEREFRVYAELYDVIKLKQNSIIDNKKIRFQDRYNWSKEVKKEFLELYQEKSTEEAGLMPGSKKVLKMLKEEGHELIIITARGKINKKMIEITKKRLKEEDMEIFDKYYWEIKDKAEICKKEKIDIMIEDSPENCKSIAKSKTKTIYFKDAPTIKLRQTKYLKTLYNWGEVYRYIKLEEANM